jgi:hypothetical protein
MDEPEKLKTYPTLRSRAYEMADTGKYRTWQEVARGLQERGYPTALRRIGGDDMLRLDLNRRCARARRTGRA